MFVYLLGRLFACLLVCLKCVLNCLCARLLVWLVLCVCLFVMLCADLLVCLLVCWCVRVFTSLYACLLDACHVLHRLRVCCLFLLVWSFVFARYVRACC